ncbi:3-hydroxybutyryl-CoA dehydrogenase [Celeribacter ethanolicus]|uniref:3-hydroxybutyryl-CoA dehydrogenase n=1 Tax=Celeribacter ethanolicus TaxID=1758178 RepID=A0A291GA98_9RHOB|nr:3-hydroxybutyryl-CoA dehydrogenase [Celeribacter ethanolicus]ATG47105.1 3-hydroxybutyryl-CoA dehydrogenase [Celeribacter ethanolicus]
MTVIQTVGVIGAGQMGRGIAQVFAQSGYDVMLQDVSSDALGIAEGFIRDRLDRNVSSGKMTVGERAETLGRLSYGSSIEPLGARDLIVESATEKEAVKVAIFESLLPHLSDHTLLTTNTSSLSITRLAAHTDRPERFMGLHFMNPVPVMKLVELIRGIATDETTFKTMQEVVARLGKTGTVSEDYPAFIVNRILVPMINEAVYTLFEGVGNVASIDASMKLGANQPMGPLELADFIGLDTCLSIMGVLNDGLADSKYRPCPLLVKYVEAGWLGRKTGRGFYDYRGADGIPVPTR